MATQRSRVVQSLGAFRRYHVYMGTLLLSLELTGPGREPQCATPIFLKQQARADRVRAVVGAMLQGLTSRLLTSA